VRCCTKPPHTRIPSRSPNPITPYLLHVHMSARGWRSAGGFGFQQLETCLVVVHKGTPLNGEPDAGILPCPVISCSEHPGSGQQCLQNTAAPRLQLQTRTHLLPTMTSQSNVPYRWSILRKAYTEPNTCRLYLSMPSCVCLRLYLSARPSVPMSNNYMGIVRTEDIIRLVVGRCSSGLGLRFACVSRTVWPVANSGVCM
jgi:hypothetical protein